MHQLTDNNLITIILSSKIIILSTHQKSTYSATSSSPKFSSYNSPTVCTTTFSLLLSRSNITQRSPQLLPLTIIPFPPTLGTDVCKSFSRNSRKNMRWPCSSTYKHSNSRSLNSYVTNTFLR